jgi:hypothetical protein
MNKMWLIVRIFITKMNLANGKGNGHLIYMVCLDLKRKLLLDTQKFSKPMTQCHRFYFKFAANLFPMWIRVWEAGHHFACQ